MKRFVLALMLGLASIFGASPVLAASIDPESVTLPVKPGERAVQSVLLRNDADEERVYSLELFGIRFGADADELIFEDLPTEQAPWVSLSAFTVTVPPGSEEQVEVTVAPSEAAAAGVFTFALIATEQVPEQVGVSVATALASVFFVEIGDSGQVRLQIESFETVPEDVRRPPVRFATLITNAGPGLAQPQVGVVVRNLWGREVEIVPLNPTGRRVPGYTHRIFSGEWEAKGLRFGPYTAELHVYPDASDTVLTATTSVVLFPWRTLGAVVTIILIVAGALFLVFRKRHVKM